MIRQSYSSPELPGAGVADGTVGVYKTKMKVGVGEGVSVGTLVAVRTMVGVKVGD